LYVEHVWKSVHWTKPFTWNLVAPFMSRLPLKSNQDGPFELPWPGIAMSWIRRTWHGLPEAAISLVALAVFGSLFIHVFRDIFSPEIAQLAPGVTRGATAVACAVIVAAGALLARKIVRGDSTLGWLDFSRLAGAEEEHAVITAKITDAVTILCTGILTGVLMTFAAKNIVSRQSLAFAAGAICSSTVICAIVATGFRPGSNGETWRPRLSLVSPSGTKSRRPATMIRWRAGLLLRSPVTWWFWGASTLAFAGMAAAAISGVASPFVAIFAWLAGWLAALPLAMEAASGDVSSHFERSLGITPEELLRSHAATGALTAVMTAALGASIAAICGRDDAIAVAPAAAATAPSLMPALLWQIDVRRPLVQWMTSLMASLFLATAIIATKAAFLLWPVVLVFLVQQQNKRLQAEMP
jgi:hypothetical protein